MEYAELFPSDELPLQLLLEADLDLNQITSYINDCMIYVLKKSSEPIGIICVQPLASHTAEIKNISIAATYQNSGLGKQLLHHALLKLDQKAFRKVIVKTGNSSIGPLAFYQKLGFRITGMEPDFFTKHYPHQEIIENGIPCKDQIELTLYLNGKGG